MRFSRTLLICSLASLLSVTAYAQVKAPATQVVDIKAGGGVTLKATYFPAGAPGPGILLLHACNKDRTSWTQPRDRRGGTGVSRPRARFSRFRRERRRAVHAGPGAAVDDRPLLAG